MARHRRYRGLVKFPGLGGISIPKSVNPVDVAVGVALGFAGSGAIKAGAAKLAAGGTKIPDFIVSAGPVMGGAATAALLYMAQKKKSPARAAGHAVGALLGGLAVSGWSMLQSSGVLGASALPLTFGKYVSTTPYWYKGKLDDVHIYSRALSAAEVKQLYNLGR